MVPASPRERYAVPVKECPMNTRSSLAAAVSLVFLLGSGAQAQDKPPPGQGGQPGGGPPGMGQGQGENMRPKEQADPALPWNPFAKAKKGDWLTFVDEQKSERGSPKVRYHIWTVENVVDDK